MNKKSSRAEQIDGFVTWRALIFPLPYAVFATLYLDVL